MTIKLLFQSILMAMVVMSFMTAVKVDFDGRKQKPPEGFAGFIGTVIATAILCTVLYFAGAFSEIF